MTLPEHGPAGVQGDGSDHERHGVDDALMLEMIRQRRTCRP
jgi:hypothetical protein